MQEAVDQESLEMTYRMYAKAGTIRREFHHSVGTENMGLPRVHAGRTLDGY